MNKVVLVSVYLFSKICFYDCKYTYVISGSMPEILLDCGYPDGCLRPERQRVPPVGRQFLVVFITDAGGL